MMRLFLSLLSFPHLMLVVFSGPALGQESPGTSPSPPRLLLPTQAEDVAQELGEIRARLEDQEASLRTLLEVAIEQMAAEEADDTARVIEELSAEVERLRAELARAREDVDVQGDSLQVLLEAALEQMEAEQERAAGASALGNLSGDLEMVFVFPQTPGLNRFDTRLALAGGFDLGRGVHLEVIAALEHGQVDGEGGGTLTLERLRADVPLTDSLDLLVGRTAVPLGVHSERNDPTRYQGVLPTATETIILPAIWTTDAIGLSGRASATVSYQLLLGSALDGSGFSADEGIRGGRMSGESGLSNPALMGRIQYLAEDQSTRLGLGIYEGFGRNGPGGVNAQTDVRVRMYAIDFERRTSAVDLRLVGAFGDLNDIQDTGTDVGYWLGGYYAEAAWHLRQGLIDGGGMDVDVFLRHEETDTQLHASPGLSAAEGDALDRETTTLGASLRPARNLVFKVDYTVGTSAAGDLPEVLALGMAWSF